MFGRVLDGVTRWLNKPSADEVAQPPEEIWTRILGREAQRWESFRAAACSGSGPRVLLATGMGGHRAVLTLDSLLAVALTLRGAKVHTLLCDGALPACERCKSTQFIDSEFTLDGPSKKLCPGCFAGGKRVYESLGLPLHTYSTLLSQDDRALAGSLASNTPVESIPTFVFEGVAVGEHARAGALRFFARGTLDDEPDASVVLRRYFEASLLVLFAVRNLLQTERIETSSFHHGIYVPQGIVGEVARSLGVRVANWQVAYRKKCFIFSHGRTYHHTLLDEPVSEWDKMEWTADLEGQTLEYLRSRYSGKQDWIWFHDSPNENTSEIVKELSLDSDRPLVAMLTNVFWDAQLHYKSNAFSDMLAWVLFTIEYFRTRPDLQLVVRVHPAEVRGAIPSRQPLTEEIAKVYPRLPENVRVIAPENQISTYALVGLCDAALIYGTKMGVELSAVGLPVLVAGEAWIRNKGLTRDASSPEQYRKLLDELPLGRRLDEETTQRARMYAYHFFFRRMVPIRAILPSDKLSPYGISLRCLSDLAEGSDPGLDAICSGILKGTPFVFRCEELQPQPSGVAEAKT